MTMLHYIGPVRAVRDRSLAQYVAGTTAPLHRILPGYLNIKQEVISLRIRTLRG